MQRNIIKHLLVPVVLLALLAANPVSNSSAQEKRRIAVLDFDYATVTSNVYAYFGSNQDVGKGIADLLVTKLVQSGVYSVIERKQIEKVLAEQNFGKSGRVDEQVLADSDAALLASLQLEDDEHLKRAAALLFGKQRCTGSTFGCTQDDNF